MKKKKIKQMMLKQKAKKKRIKEYKKQMRDFKDKILNSDMFIPEYVENWKSENMSWFDIKSLNYNIVNKEINVSTPNISENELLRAKQISIIFTDEQKKIILNWMEISRLIYNLTVNYYKHNPIKSFISDRPIIKNMFSDSIKKRISKSNMPEHIIDDSINDVIKAYASSNALKYGGHQKKFRIREKKQNKPKKTIVIQSRDFNVTNSFYSSNLNDSILVKLKKDLKDKYQKNFITNKQLNIEVKKYKEDNKDTFTTKKKLNESAKQFKENRSKYVKKVKDFNEEFKLIKHNLINLKTSQPINKSCINHDTRLSYNTLNNKFSLKVPEDRTKIILRPQYNSCGIDGGLVSFLTGYSQEGYCFKISNRYENSKLYNYTKKKMLAKKLIKEHNKSKYKRFFKRVSRRIQNLTKELHYKSALFICKNFDNIFLGKLSTKGITSKKNKLSRLDKEFAYAVSHDKFRTIITNKAEEYCRNLYIVNESSTSRTCGRCGIGQDIKGREFKCKYCKLHACRDLHAARNIQIKNQ